MYFMHNSDVMLHLYIQLHRPNIYTNGENEEVPQIAFTFVKMAPWLTFLLLLLL